MDRERIVVRCTTLIARKKHVESQFSRQGINLAAQLNWGILLFPALRDACEKICGASLEPAEHVVMGRFLNLPHIRTRLSVLVPRGIMQTVLRCRSDLSGTLARESVSCRH